MKIVRNKVRLEKRYITTPLDTDTLGKLLTSKNAGILHRIYLIKNKSYKGIIKKVMINGPIKVLIISMWSFFN